MGKEEYIGMLRGRLYGLPDNEIEERVCYFRERIESRISQGMNEEAAVASLGPIDDTVSQIMNEIPLTRLVADTTRPEKKHGLGWILLIIFTFPVWFPFLVVAFALILALYIVLWSFVICFFAVDLAFFVGALLMIPVAVAYFGSGNPAGGCLFIGVGMVLLGLSILLLFCCIAMVKGCVKLLAKMVLGIKACFVGRRA